MNGENFEGMVVGVVVVVVVVVMVMVGVQKMERDEKWQERESKMDKYYQFDVCFCFGCFRCRGKSPVLSTETSG